MLLRLTAEYMPVGGVFVGFVCMSHFFKLGAALRRDAAVQPTTGALRCDSASSCDSGVRAASPQAGSNLFRVSVALGTVRPVEPAAGLSTSEPAGSLVPASPSISPYAPTATIADVFHICKRERIDRRRTTTRPYNSIKRTKREDDTKYARPGSFKRLFGATVEETQHGLLAPCCKLQCGRHFTLRDVVDCRLRNYSLDESGVTAMLSNMFFTFCPRGTTIMYRHQGRPICRAKFEFLWGVLPAKIQAARHMWLHSVTSDTHGLLGTLREHTMETWLYAVLLCYLQEEAERIAGCRTTFTLRLTSWLSRLLLCPADGYWHLHDNSTNDEMLIHCQEEWNKKITEDEVFAVCTAEWATGAIFSAQSGTRPESKSGPTKPLVASVLRKVLSSPIAAML